MSVNLELPETWFRKKLQKVIVQFLPKRIKMKVLDVTVGYFAFTAGVTYQIGVALCGQCLDKFNPQEFVDFEFVD